MSINDSIRITLNIKDLNIKFDDHCVVNEVIKGIQSIVYLGHLDPELPDSCPICGCVCENHSIIKHGTKSSLIKMPSVSNMNTYLRLRKQRYLCKNCNQTFSASTDLVSKNCFISNSTKTAVVLEGKEKLSQKDIARLFNVSHGTVNQIYKSLYSDFIIPRNFLPKHLSFDEFNAVKALNGRLAFMVIDAENGNVINVLETRYSSDIIKYFMSYSRKARLSVQTVCMDMHAPYMNVVRICFPNAQIIIDRFHIVQLISRSLNQTRIDTMKAIPAYAKKLKKYWKLILKSEDELDDEVFRPRYYYRHFVRESDIVHDLLSCSEELSNTYDLYQKLLRCIKSKDYEKLLTLIQKTHLSISGKMRVSIKTLRKYSEGVRNALIYEYSNGRIEGTNNKIKVLKRIAFGYRSFVSFKVRILLVCNTLVRIHQNTKKEGNFAFQ